MRSMKYFSLSAAFFLVAGTLAAQMKQPLTVRECVELGLAKSRGLHASGMNVETASAKFQEVSAMRMPTLKFSGAYTRLSEVPPFAIDFSSVSQFIPVPNSFPTTFVVSPSFVNSYNLRLMFQEPLFTGFRLQSSVEMAQLNVRAAEEDYDKDRNELVLGIQTAYWNLFRALELKKMMGRSVEISKAHLTDVENFYAQGLLTKNEVFKVQAQLSQLEFLKLEAKNAVELATVFLNNLIGLPLDAEIEPISRVGETLRDESKEGLGDVQKLMDKALSSRPELKAMDFRVKASERGITLAKSSWYPQILLAGNYYYSRPNPRILPTKDKFIRTWDIGIVFFLDIWNWGTTIQQTRQAKAQLSQAQDALSLMRDSVTVEVMQSYLSFKQAKEKIEVAEQGVKQAEENYRVTSDTFKQGLALNSEVMDAEFLLLQAKTNSTQALIDFELARARLQKVVGGPF